MKSSIKLFSALCLLLTIATSCDKVGNVKIPFGAQTFKIIVPQSPVAGEISLAESVIEANIDSILSANKAAKDKIKGITVTGIKMTMIDGDDSVHFGLLQSIKTSLTKDGITFQSAGELTNNPDVVSYSIIIPGNKSLNVREYLDGNSTFKATAVTRGPIMHAVTIEVTMEMEIEAGLLD